MSDYQTIGADLEAQLERINSKANGWKPDATYEAARLDRERAKSEASLRASGAPSRHLSADRGNLDRSGPWGQAFSKIQPKLGTGFIVALIGLRGTGKTQMAVELADLVIQGGKTAHFTTATKFLMAIKATYRKDSPKSEEDILREHRKFSFLAIDEVGRRADTDWEDRLLFELINDRYNDLKDTLLISNDGPGEFEKKIGPSLTDRIIETGGIVNCSWKSYRQQ
jgi:DNA replication protein DnaC